MGILIDFLVLTKAPIPFCFLDAIAEGINLEMIEKETLATVDTKGDIKKVLKTIYDSVGLETDIN